MQLATKTLAAIDHEGFRTQCGTFRVALGKIIMDSPDAYVPQSETAHRQHLGCSVLGKDCDRAIWYGFRWVKEPKFSARMLRLFNRGHLEEPRFFGDVNVNWLHNKAG